MNIGFVGIGVMGRSMAHHLLKAGHEINVFTRTKAKADELLSNGAQWKSSLKELAESSEVIITMIGYPKDVEDVYFKENGLLQSAKSGTTLIDMTTSKPSLAERIAKASEERGCSALDAPVSGGDVGAKNGTLTIMVGGSEQTFEKMLPVFELMGTNIQLHGPAGSGQHAKMCNQIAVAASMIGAGEALGYAKQAGLDQQKVLDTISKGAGGSWTLNNLAPRMLNGDFEPGFYVKHFIKDMDIALEEVEAMDKDLPGLALVKSLYDELAEKGETDSGTQSIYKLWQ
ncbi:oxidoreductase [Bacillaceae bacterium JMAK1]|nr:oxidoreductase [Bacillaceae bacterium JMAK1]